MRIIACVKAVPSSTEVKMDPKTNTIVRDGKQAVINPFDATALECALQARETLTDRGANVTVTALSMGIPATADLLRDCVARGADSGVLLSDRAFAGADTLATCYALTLGIEHIGNPDLIVCGKMAVDGDTAQIGPELAGAFDIPCVTDVSEISEVTCDHIVVAHVTDEGHDVVDVPLPAVITVGKDVAQLRMPSIAGVLAAEDLNRGPHRNRRRCGPRPLRTCGIAHPGRVLICSRAHPRLHVYRRRYRHPGARPRRSS